MHDANHYNLVPSHQANHPVVLDDNLSKILPPVFRDHSPEQGG